MAFPQSLCIFVSLIVLANVANCVTGIREVESRVPTVHEILQQHGFPKGLLPRSIKSYTFSSDGSFQVDLEGACDVHFGKRLVHYDSRITGKLKHGSVSNVVGIQALKLFVWVPLTGIEADETSGMLVFLVGLLWEKLPAKQFEKIHKCENQIGLLESAVVGSIM